MDEFEKWTPSIPVVMYHGTPAQRQEIFSKKIMKHLQKGRPTDKFPVVCTSYEMVLQDKASLSRINWEFIIIVSRQLHIPKWPPLISTINRMKAIA